MIINHNHPRYQRIRRNASLSQYNGAYFYSQEICRRIIPRVKTDRNWITIRVPEVGADHSIVFIHNNLNPERYDYLKRWRDLVLVCGIPETVPKVEHLGKAIYLPLSIDVAEVEKYKRDDRHGTAFAGRATKRFGRTFPEGTQFISGLVRPEFLRKMARFEKIYAVGRVALEARALGCEVLPYDPRFPDPERWELMDNVDAAKILQMKLDLIDGVER